MVTQGHIILIRPTKVVSDKFRVREFVVELGGDSKWPQTVQFQVTQDGCEVLDSLAVGEEVRLDFNLRGRKWTSPTGEVKYFNSLDVRDIARIGPPVAAPVAPAPAQESADDIPF